MRNKLTYSIGHVAEMVDVTQSTLRYWETVIDALKPVKTAGGSRRYTTEDIALIQKLKVLLHDEGLTIKGVNKYLASRGKGMAAEDVTASGEVITGTAGELPSDLLQEILARLKEIKNILENDEE